MVSVIMSLTLYHPYTSRSREAGAYQIRLEIKENRNLNPHMYLQTNYKSAHPNIASITHDKKVRGELTAARLTQLTLLAETW
jgi:hypothetical protein